jgi:transmembrane sensor
MSGYDTQALIEAATWRTRLAETDQDSTPAFEAWLAASPGNAAAWKQVQAPWEFVGEHATSPEMIELRRAALAHAQEASRAPNEPARQSRTAHANSQLTPTSRWRRFGYAAQAKALVAAAVLLIVVGAGWIWEQSLPDVYQTMAGERSVVTLVDGSQVALDSSSEVRVRYSVGARELTLARGQARFDVAHDSARPFSVTARGHTVIATGTAFNVDLFGPSVLVTLIEGHVVVVSQTGDSATKDPIRVAAVGEQLVFSPATPPSVAHVAVERATSWQNGEIIFENDPLSTVVARLNRYARNPVVITDPSTSALRISGVFHTGDIDGFVATIVSYLPVEARKDADGTTLLAHR